MTLRIISLNLWWGGNLMPALLEFLKNQDADVVALQEVHDGRGAQLKERQRSMEVLRAQLQYPYDDFAQALVLNEPEGKVSMGNAILSKFPITRSSTTFLVESTRADYDDVPEQWPIFPRVLQGADINTPGGEASIFNWHGVWDMAGDNPSPERRRMIEKTLATIEGKSKVILTGDSNATLGNPVLRGVEARLTSVFGQTLVTTFNMRRKKISLVTPPPRWIISTSAPRSRFCREKLPMLTFRITCPWS
jgi:endonuclease/exonuclease/phosphatase family metal-dependent hydrolase